MCIDHDLVFIPQPCLEPQFGAAKYPIQIHEAFQFAFQHFLDLAQHPIYAFAPH